MKFDFSAPVRIRQHGRETRGVVSFDQAFTAEIEYEVKRALVDVRLCCAL